MSAKYLFQWVVVVINSLVPWLQLASSLIIKIISRIRRGWRAEVRWRSIRTIMVVTVALTVVSGWLASHSKVLTCYCFKSLILFFRQAELLEALYLWHKLHIELLTISIWSIFCSSKHFLGTCIACYYHFEKRDIQLLKQITRSYTALPITNNISWFNQTPNSLRTESHKKVLET